MQLQKALLCLHALTIGVSALWPLPKNLETGGSIVKLSPKFDITLSAELELQGLSDLHGAISRTKVHLVEDKHQRLNEGRGESDRGDLKRAPYLSSLVLSIKFSNRKVQPISVEAVKPIYDRGERYSLTLPSDGSPATIEADTTLGLLRGLTTFEQLWYWLGDGEEGTVYSYETPVVIKDDSPSYPYRGFHLDTSRNFFPPSDILRTLDAMSMAKMSIFQWHVVDSQSFPLDVPGYPEISRHGAYSLQSSYSTGDVQRIVKYAAERGIDVLMEIDTPGHTTSIAHSHPEHIACANAEPWHDYAAQSPAGQLRVSSAETRKFAASLLKNVAETLPSTMFGTGGDEINMRCYLDDEQTKKELREAGLPVSERGINMALDEFIEVTHGVLKDLKKTPVVWEEIALEHGLTKLDVDNTIVTIWTDSNRAVDAVKKGFHIVHAPSNFFYLDCGAGGWLGDWPTGNSWCDPFKTWQKAYTFDPLQSITPDQAHLVLGGQQLLWSEQSSPENLDSIVWPRAAASAEVFWTGPLKGSDRSIVDALPRLHDLRFRMVQRGIKAIPLQPYWCAIHPGQCVAGPWAQALASIENLSDNGTRRLRRWIKRMRKTWSLIWRVFYEL